MGNWKWKLIGLAGVAGVTAAGVVVARRRRRRQWDEVEPDELRRRLHDRLNEADNTAAGSRTETG